MKKILCLISAVMLHLAVGSVYAWSVLVNPIIDYTGWSNLSLVIVFGITIACLGFSTLFLGRYMKKVKPVIACCTAFCCYLTGMGMTSAAIHYHSFILLLTGYGFVLGFGTGIAYLTPIPILMTWFKTWRGVATGMVVTGFGCSSLIAAAGYHYCIIHYGLEYAPIYTGFFMSLLMIPSFFFLRSASDIEEKELEHYKGVKQLLNNKQFKLLWVLFFINISIGVAVISAMSPMLQDIFNVSARQAALFVGTAGIVNGASRFCWSLLSDLIGRPLTVIVLIVFELTALISLIYFMDYDIFKTCILVIVTCYGGLFAIMPSYIADLFGVNKVQETFGYILTAWGIAGLIAPVTLILSVNYTGSYSDFFYFALILCLINSIIALSLSERNVLRV